MATLTTLKARIASELHRDNLTTEIASAITSAIDQHKSRRFEFNQLQASFNTIANQEDYNSADAGFPDDIGQIDSLRVTVNDRKVVLKPLTFQELQALSTTTTSYGDPSYWAWYAQSIFFYPIPDAVYSVLVSYQQRKDAPANDADGTTIWTNQCEPLIRATAKKLLARDVINDPDEYARSKDAESEALGMLMRESLQLQDEGGLQPSW